MRIITSLSGTTLKCIDFCIKVFEVIVPRGMALLDYKSVLTLRGIIIKII